MKRLAPGASAAAEAAKHGISSTEFWSRVRLVEDWQSDPERVAALVLSEIKHGQCLCSKCKGTGTYEPLTGAPGVCYRCSGKGWESHSDLRRNFGYRVNNPSRYAVSKRRM